MGLWEFSDRLAAQFYVLGGGNGGTLPTMVLGTPVNFAATATFSIDFPADVQDGDYAVLAISSSNVGGDANYSSDDIGAFATYNSQGNGTLRVAVAANPTDMTFAGLTAVVTLTAAATGIACIVIVRGSDQTIPDGDRAGGSGTSSTPVGNTTTTGHNLIVLFTGFEIAAASTPDTGWTEDIDSGTVDRLCIDHKEQVAAGTVTGGTRSFLSSNWCCIELAFQSP